MSIYELNSRATKGIKFCKALRLHNWNCLLWHIFP